MDMLCSTFDLRFHQSPGSVLAMTNSRRLGVAYTYNATHYYACGGLFTDNDISNLKNTSQGYAVLFYGPVNEAGTKAMRVWCCFSPCTRWGETGCGLHGK